MADDARVHSAGFSYVLQGPLAVFVRYLGTAARMWPAPGAGSAPEPADVYAEMRAAGDPPPSVFFVRMCTPTVVRSARYVCADGTMALAATPGGTLRWGRCGHTPDTWGGIEFYNDALLYLNYVYLFLHVDTPPHRALGVKQARLDVVKQRGSKWFALYRHGSPWEPETEEHDAELVLMPMATCRRQG